MKQHSWSMPLVLCLVGALSLMGAELVWPQEPVGIVTALQGTVQLTRPALPTPVAWRFKDGLQVRDIVDTQEPALLRILFGGKSTVTVRELSRMEVRAEALPGGGTLAIHERSSGSILVNVARRLLRPGDEIQIRTPNAVAAVRGTTISAWCHAELAQRSFTVLTGSAMITPRQGSPPLPRRVVLPTRAVFTSVYGRIRPGSAFPTPICPSPPSPRGRGGIDRGTGSMSRLYP